VPTMVHSIVSEYRRYKALGEGAIAQLSDSELSQPGPNGANSMAILVWHLSGNFASRFSAFLTSDGEKPWRQRESEFEARSITRDELMTKWNGGWQILLEAIEALSDADLQKTVTIRKESLLVYEALHRSLAHCGYHVGQMVYLARIVRGVDWKWLSIPPDGSAAYNQNPTMESAARHADKLNKK
jgi:hypothetical protein